MFCLDGASTPHTPCNLSTLKITVPSPHRCGNSIHTVSFAFQYCGISRASNACAVIPCTHSRLRRASAPAWSCTCARGTIHCSAINLINSSLAAPSIGRAASRILRASPCIPTHSVRDELGWTWTVRIAPRSLSRTITDRESTRRDGSKRSLWPIPGWHAAYPCRR